MSDTYSDVDVSADPGAAVEWQERMANWPDVVAYKRMTHDLLGASELILDVGCGAGDDLIALGPERCLGVDRSAAMCDRARERGARVVRGDAVALPLVDASVAAVRSDRTLQHVVDPVAALREFLRVLRPGAPLVVADPDQESLVIQVPGVRQSVLDRLKALRRDVGYRSGRWISKAPALLESLGARVTAVEAFVLTIRDPADAFGLPAWPDHWRLAGRFTDEEVAEWNGAIVEPGSGFLYAVTFLVVAGEKQ